MSSVRETKELNEVIEATKTAKPVPVKDRTSTFVLLGIAALLGLTWYFGKDSVLVKDLAEDEKKADPTLTDEEAIALAAVKVSNQALYAAQQAEILARVQEAADKARLWERQLAAAQSQAIFTPTDPEAVAVAEAAEAEARAARADLEATWTLALNTATGAMDVAKAAANDAVDAHISAYNKYLKFVDIAAQAFLTVQKAQGDINALGWWYWPPTMVQLEQALTSAENQLRLMTDLREQHLASAQATKSDAYMAISNANDCVERVLTITADIRLLGILLALADRTDAIAIATRTKLGGLERRLDATGV